MTPDKTHSDALAPCPFCGAPAHGYAIEPHSHSPAVLRLVPELPDHPGSYVIEGQCACGSGLIGANEAEVVARWNTRWGSPVVAGEPYAYAVYFPDQPTEELVHDLDDLCDDLTNREHTITKLYTTPQPTHAQTGAVPLTAKQMESGRDAIFSTNNPYCPCDSKTFRKVAEWVERHHGIKGGQHAE